MKRDRRCDVYGVGLGRGERFDEIGPGGNVVGLGFGGVARDDTCEPAARLGEDGGKYSFGSDIADADEQPAEHGAMIADGVIDEAGSVQIAGTRFALLKRRRQTTQNDGLPHAKEQIGRTVLNYESSFLCVPRRIVRSPGRPINNRPQVTNLPYTAAKPRCATTCAKRVRIVS